MNEDKQGLVKIAGNIALGVVALVILISSFWPSGDDKRIDQQNPSETKRAQSEQTTQQKPTEEQQEDDSIELLEKIETRIEVQDVVNEEGKIKAVVYVKNNTDKVFSGHVQFVISDDGVSRGTAAFDITDLNPGEETYGIMWIRPGTKAEVLPFWMEYTFE